MSDYLQYLVTVKLDTGITPPTITFSGNPSIPSGAIATITWGIQSDSEDFTFRKFCWCDDKGFLSADIHQDMIMVVVVNNQNADNAGDWGYRIRIKTSSGEHLWSADCASGTCQHEIEVGDGIATGATPVIVNEGGPVGGSERAEHIALSRRPVIVNEDGIV